MYEVTVRATVGRDTGERMVRVTVGNVDEAPEIIQGGLAISGQSSVDYAEDRTDAVGTYTARGENAARARWTLEGDDGSDFSLSSTSGASVMLRFRSSPDYESPADAGTNNVYMVTLKVTEGTDTDTHEVTVMVTDVDEIRTVSGPSSRDYMENGTDAVGTYTVSGESAAGARLSLEGDDAADFSISNDGMLTFRVAPDYETAADANTDNIYMVTVKATAGGEMDTQDVTVTVTDVGELGMLAGESAITYMENGTDAVGTYTADGPVAASWSVEGDDMGAFSIGGSSGELMFASPPDFEAPADMGMDNIYQGDCQGRGRRRNGHAGSNCHGD